MITIKKLQECSINDVVHAWNIGFEGYLVPIKMTAETFLNRMIFEGLSPNLSIVAYYDSTPIGIVLNGIRDINGTKVAWNGGTGIAPDYRGKGLGKQIVEKSLEIYRENKVEIATLEAIFENHTAIHLYKKLGYEVRDHVGHFSTGGTFSRKNHRSVDFQVVRGLPCEATYLPFYKANTTWQTQWKSIVNGESIILKDLDGKPIAYALFKRLWNDHGDLKAINLYQLEASPEQNQEIVLSFLLNEVFQHFDGPKNIINYSLSNKMAVHSFQQYGFEEKVKQVYMTKNL